MFTRSHFSLKLPTYVETILTKQLHDLIVTKLCQTPGDRLYLKNQEMLCNLKYFSFLRQLKGHNASNKLVMKDFDLKFRNKNGFLAYSEALCMCPRSFDFIFLNSKLSFEKIKELFINFHTFDFRP